MASPRQNGLLSTVTRVRVLILFGLGLVALAGPGLWPEAAAAATTAQRGYVLVDTAGATTGFGEAAAAGSLAGVPLASPIVDGVNTPSGRGHILVAADGGVFAFGDAPYLGSMVGTPLNGPIVS
ncbi:MAG: hypothetical protein M3394_00705, partial [Actinomycetota bacterium]|nr:hypothetical protein [Actinomycetota bacterium]